MAKYHLGIILPILGPDVGPNMVKISTCKTETKIEKQGQLSEKDAQEKSLHLSLKVCEHILDLLIKRCIPGKKAKIAKVSNMQKTLQAAFGSDSDNESCVLGTSEDISSDEGDVSVYQPSPEKLGMLSPPSGSDIDTDLTKLAKYVEGKDDNDE